MYIISMIFSERLFHRIRGYSKEVNNSLLLYIKLSQYLYSNIVYSTISCLVYRISYYDIP